jgi:hypothetical protein
MRPGRARHSTALATLAALAACSHVPPPDWQLDARLFTERAAQAYLQGDARLEAMDFEKARSQIARTGRVDLIARVELMRCATRVASLQFEPCDAFMAFAAQAAAPERAYADYLAARLQAGQIDLLPPEQQPVAAAALRGEPAAAALAKTPHPLSLLVAAGVLLESGRADPAVAAIAIDTASAQGWRRPLLAWLHVALAGARQRGEAAQVQALQLRIDLVQGTP